MRVLVRSGAGKILPRFLQDFFLVVGWQTVKPAEDEFDTRFDAPLVLGRYGSDESSHLLAQQLSLEIPLSALQCASTFHQILLVGDCLLTNRKSAGWGKGV